MLSDQAQLNFLIGLCCEVSRKGTRCQCSSMRTCANEGDGALGGGNRGEGATALGVPVHLSHDDLADLHSSRVQGLHNQARRPNSPVAVRVREDSCITRPWDRAGYLPKSGGPLTTAVLGSWLCCTCTESRKAAACSCAACPMDESMTKTIKSGATAPATARISSNSASLCLCRPLVSTMIRSRPSALNLSQGTGAV